MSLMWMAAGRNRFLFHKHHRRFSKIGTINAGRALGRAFGDTYPNKLNCAVHMSRRC